MYGKSLHLTGADSTQLAATPSELAGTQKEP